MRRHIISAGLAAMLACAPALAAPSVVVLGGDAGDDPVTACGALASSPYEPGRIGAGLDDAGVFLDGATAACEAALAAAPDSIEVQTWLGRVYVLTGRAAEAQQLLDAAIEGGSGYAAFLLSELLASGAAAADDPDRAHQLLQQAADSGYLPAMSALAEVSEAAADYATAFNLYSAAAGQGLGLASYRLGYFYHSGLAVDFNFETAMTFYQQAIEQGEPLGHFGVGQLHEYGQGVEQDYLKAAAAYQLGADRKEKFSETALAYLYEQGMGVEQDYSRSFPLLLDAAAQGHGFAQAALAIHYLFGQGTEIDEAKAYDLAWSAQRQGVVYAEGILGYMMMYGLGTERSLSNALFHFRNGQELGDQYSADQIAIVEAELACLEAAGSQFEPGNISVGVDFAALDPAIAIPACEQALQFNATSLGDKVWLARAYAKAERYDEALPLLEEGISGGNVLAETVLADLLIRGTGVEANPPRAIALYLNAAGSSFAPAQYGLGVAYAEGLGVAADSQAAIGWFRQALEQGMDDAQAQIDLLAGASPETSVDMTGFGREGPGY
ncbi:MAG: sel1 repeat family protein [Hyphomicrobiales bacterium]|nr:MAG: sel1 repeat family protein [Hyphomicrobiales bacterium]